MNRDGSDAHAVTSGGSASKPPRWFPDGRRIAFHQRVVGANNSPATFDVAILDITDDAPPIVVATDAALLGYFCRDLTGAVSPCS